MAKAPEGKGMKTKIVHKFWIGALVIAGAYAIVFAAIWAGTH